MANYSNYDRNDEFDEENEDYIDNDFEDYDIEDYEDYDIDDFEDCDIDDFDDEYDFYNPFISEIEDLKSLFMENSRRSNFVKETLTDLVSCYLFDCIVKSPQNNTSENTINLNLASLLSLKESSDIDFANGIKNREFYQYIDMIYMFLDEVSTGEIEFDENLKGFSPFEYVTLLDAFGTTDFLYENLDYVLNGLAETSIQNNEKLDIERRNNIVRVINQDIKNKTDYSIEYALGDFNEISMDEFVLGMEIVSNAMLNTHENIMNIVNSNKLDKVVNDNMIHQDDSFNLFELNSILDNINDDISQDSKNELLKDYLDNNDEKYKNFDDNNGMELN